MTSHDIGTRVREAREQRGLSLSDAARLTRLPQRVLLAIEQNDFDSLPAGMYRKAYLRTVAAEVGLDPREICAAYEQRHHSSVDVELPIDRTPDHLVEELAPSRPRGLVPLAVCAALSIVWYGFQPRTVPAAVPFERVVVQSASPASPASADAESAVTVERDTQEGVRLATAVTTPGDLLKVDLTTTGWCWMAAQRDGERLVYGLVEPGRSVVIEGSRISLRLGNAGAVQLSVNDGPPRTPGADGEVVELEFASDDASLATGVSN